MKSKLFDNNFRLAGQYSFNTTAIVDIVFLLIIFFMLVCQFIVAENFDVNIPRDTVNGKVRIKKNEEIITVSVKINDDGNICYAVGPEIITANRQKILERKITATINANLKNIKQPQKIVNIRMDKDICFDRYQLVLAAIAKSSATDVRFAVLNTGQKDTAK